MTSKYINIVCFYRFYHIYSQYILTNTMQYINSNYICPLIQFHRCIGYTRELSHCLTDLCYLHQVNLSNIQLAIFVITLTYNMVGRDIVPFVSIGFFYMQGVYMLHVICNWRTSHKGTTHLYDVSKPRMFRPSWRKHIVFVLSVHW